ncbi:MAG: tetracycline destructase [Parachlamydiaceae bacterium]|nr:tetracycline destructase [Parachlamydiaceae bacterium]
MSHINKILVIGAGIAGPAVCYWLKRFGFSPTLIEKFPDLRKGGQALDLRGVAIDLIKRMDIYEKIYNLRTQLEIGRYVDAEGNTLHEEKGERFGFREGEDVEIIRGDLIEILMGAIEGVPCYFNQLIDSIKQNEDGVRVYFKDGRNELYDLVIGADGIHSATRRMVFDEDEYKFVNLGGYFSIFSIPNYLNLSNTEVLCEANQKLASIASHKNSKMAQVAFMFRSQHAVNNIRGENNQKQFLRDTYQDFSWEVPKMLELMSKSDDFYFDSVAQVKMESWTKGRVALLGDAGYCASPLSGQGNNLALVGAFIFAGELKKAEGNYNRAFNRYNELLRPFVEANQKLGAWVSESFLVQDEVSKEVAEERSDMILQEVRIVSNAISLPDYE